MDNKDYETKILTDLNSTRVSLCETQVKLANAVKLLLEIYHQINKDNWPDTYDDIQKFFINYTK